MHQIGLIAICGPKRKQIYEVRKVEVWMRSTAKPVHPRMNKLSVLAMQHLFLAFSVVFSHFITTIPPLLPSGWTTTSAMFLSADTNIRFVSEESGGASFYFFLFFNKDLAPWEDRRSIGVKKCSLHPPNNTHPSVMCLHSSATRSDITPTWYIAQSWSITG